MTLYPTELAYKILPARPTQFTLLDKSMTFYTKPADTLRDTRIRYVIRELLIEYKDRRLNKRIPYGIRL